MWLHGSLGRDAATGRGTAFAIRELLRALGMGEVEGKTFVIQASQGAALLRSRVCCRGAAPNLSCWSCSQQAARQPRSAAGVPHQANPEPPA